MIVVWGVRIIELSLPLGFIYGVRCTSLSGVFVFGKHRVADAKAGEHAEQTIARRHIYIFIAIKCSQTPPLSARLCSRRLLIRTDHVQVNRGASCLACFPGNGR